MIKTLTALALTLMLTACGDDSRKEHLEYVQHNTNFEIVRTIEMHGNDTYGYTGRHIVIIDGVEYIWSYRNLGQRRGTESLTRK